MKMEPSFQTNEQTTKRVTKSYNSNYQVILGKCEQKVLDIVKNSPIPITPLAISKESGINPNSIRVVVRKLCRQGFIDQPFYGHYRKLENQVTLGGVGGSGVTLGGDGDIRIHKLLFVVKGVCGVVSGVVLDSDLYSVRFVVYRGGVNVYVNCKGSYAFDYPSFRLLVEFVKAKLGVGDDVVIVIPNYELNCDYSSIQLDGCKALTLRAFDGSFERLYNKNKRTLRSEVCLQNASLTPERAYALLKGGVVPYDIFQCVYLLVQEVRAEREIWKLIARNVIDQKLRGFSEGVQNE